MFEGVNIARGEASAARDLEQNRNP